MKYLWLLMVCLLAACKSDEPLSNDSPAAAEGPALEISVDGGFTIQGRAAQVGSASSGYKLVSSEAVQHIEEMYAYLFKGADEKATCVFVKKLPWQASNQPGASLTYRLKEANLAQYNNADMQVLVVGIDNRKDTYTFPAADAAYDSQDMLGKALADVKLALAQQAAGNPTGEDAAYRMANTEVFSGYQTFKAANQTIPVTLKRCVAGVLCYLTDLPYYVGGQEETDVIESVELQLGGGCQLNTKLKDFYGEPQGVKDVPADAKRMGYGSNPLQDGKVIASVNLSEYIYGKGVTNEELATQKENPTLLYIPEQENGVVVTKPNTLLFGAYLIPIEAKATSDANTDATLKLVVKSQNGQKTQDYVIKNGQAAADKKYAYSLDANYIYSIGSKPVAADTELDRPASLLGGELIFEVNDWGEGDNGVEFPDYALTSSFSADWGENYRFDCINTTRMVDAYLSQEAVEGKKNVRIGTHDNTTGLAADWIEFRFKDEATGDSLTDWSTNYTITKNEIQETSRLTIEVRIYDYVKENWILGNAVKYPTFKEQVKALLEDYRSGALQLYYEGETVPAASLPIKQFNAITSHDDGVAYSRVDVGDELLDSGYVAGLDNTGKAWGFNGEGLIHIYGDGVYDDDKNGEENSNIVDKRKPSGYGESALKLARNPALDKDLDGRVWFLPAYYQADGFQNLIYNMAQEAKTNPDLVYVANGHKWLKGVNISYQDDFPHYWLSSFWAASQHKAYVIAWNQKEPDTKYRTEIARLRQVRKFK